MGTNDVRVIALDARTGMPCADFGNNGEVKPETGMPLEWPRRIPDHVSAGGGQRRRHGRFGDCGQSPRRGSIRHGACVRCAGRDGRDGVSIRWSMTASSQATPMSGRRCRWTRIAGWFSCRPRRRARISGAASGPATTSTPIRWWRCAPTRVNWCGRSRPCITMSGILTCRHSRRWRASTLATGRATS
jgi:hypothetical protein